MCLFVAGHLLTFITHQDWHLFEVGTYLRLGACQLFWQSGWALVRSGCLIVAGNGHLLTFLTIRVGSCLRLGTYSNKYDT